MSDEAEARFELRHGTQDYQVFDDVVVKNQYRLPDSLADHHLVIDIGANIGTFAVACLLRGAGTVVCFEPSADNFAQLGKNIQSWPEQVVAFNAAVWRSDGEQELSFYAQTGSATGCCVPACVANGPRINAIGLDQVILECTDNGQRRVQLLKIDAEYSEYPILYTAMRLDLVDAIIGEAHGFHDGCLPENHYYTNKKYQNSADGIRKFLQDQGFAVTTEAEHWENQINTLFFATRTPETK